MSTILHSIGEVKPHAPLSGGQTVAVFQQLHGEILNALKLLEDQRRELERKGDNLLKLTNDVSLTNTNLQDLRNDFKAMGKRVDGVGSQAGDALELGQKLRTGLQLAREDINYLREGQQTTNSNVDIIKSNLDLRTDEIKGLRSDVDNVLKAGLQDLQEKMSQTMLSLRALTLDHEKTKKEASQQKSRVQGLSDDLADAREDLQKLGGRVGKQGSLLTETCNKLEATKTNLEITNAVVYKLNERSEETSVDVSNLKDGMISANSRMDGLQFEQGKTAKDLAQAREDLASAQTTVNSCRQGLARAMDNIGALREGHEKATTNANQIANDLAKVKNLADATHHHLEVTNSMVLPNLSTGDMSPAGFHSSTEGARSMGNSSFSKTGGLQTPRRRREATWVSRNIGIVPDRMSWI